MSTLIHKPRVTKRPFSRLSDGKKHPVVVTRMSAGEPARTKLSK